MLNKWESDFDQLRHIDSTDPNEAINTSDSSNILKLIWEQRDRFKNKIHELESENRTLEQKFKACEIQIKSLKNDNIKLYEKIRYLQTYGQNSTEAVTDLEAAQTDNVESRYKDMYETSVNPFVVFNKKVKSERYKSLNPAEKLILSTTQFFLSTKQTRLFLFAYLVSLHFLVFSTLWRIVHV